MCSEEQHTYHTCLKKDFFVKKTFVKFLHPSKFMCKTPLILKEKIYVAHITYAKDFKSSILRSVTPVHNFSDSQKEISKFFFSNNIKLLFL